MSQKSANYNLETALAYALEKYRQRDPATIVIKSGCPFNEEAKIFIVRYYNRDYLVSYPDGEVRAVSGEPVSLKERILFLHYLTDASGLPLSGEKISFKELPDAHIYADPFNRRALFPFISLFGSCPELLAPVAEKLGGYKDNFGDISVTIAVFPRIPVTFVLWLGDDEFPPNGTILFDRSAGTYLPAEDFAVIAQDTVFKMKALLNKLRQEEGQNRE